MANSVDPSTSFMSSLTGPILFWWGQWIGLYSVPVGEGGLGGG